MSARWVLQDLKDVNLHAGSGVVKSMAMREFPLNPGYGFADYLLYIDGKAAGVIEAKKARERNAVDEKAVDLRPARQPALHAQNQPAWA